MTDKVLLTGISGWIAKHTAIELLNSGYEVLGTVRSDDVISQTKETISKHASIDKLSFIKLDLLSDEGWEEASSQPSSLKRSSLIKDNLSIEACLLIVSFV